MIAERTFPCVGAKSAAAQDALEVMVARDITIGVPMGDGTDLVAAP